MIVFFISSVILHPLMTQFWRYQFKRVEV